MDTTHAEVVTCCEAPPLIKSHNSLNTWPRKDKRQIKQVISPIAVDIWPPNKARCGLVVRGSDL